MDGVDVDFEDLWQENNPGLTGYGVTRVPGSGLAVEWLCVFARALKAKMGADR